MARLTWFLPAIMLIVTICGMAVPKCGVPDVPPDQSKDLIVGGQPAKRYAWPWQIALYLDKSRFICGGSIIAPQWILTAAHCCENLSAKRLTVLVGKHNLSAVESTQRKYTVSKIIKHEKYVSDYFDYDICLLRLSDQIEFSSSAKPVCLPDKDAGPGNFYATGWGDRNFDEPRGGTDVLYQVMLPLYDQRKCMNIYSKGQITPDMLCAGYDQDTKKDTCIGDSGGPLVRKVGDQWRLYGLTSFGPDDCSRTPPVMPGVYARVHYFLNWIKRHSSVTPPSE